jgi:deoxyribose-phosphate aldolase
MNISAAELAAHIDTAMIVPEATMDDMRRCAAEANACKLAAICVPGAWVREVAPLVSPPVKMCGVIAFPHGNDTAAVKAFAAVGVIKDGAEEIDLVANLSYLINADVDAARAELKTIERAARVVRRDVVIKVIVESAVLMALGPERAEAALATACRAIRESGCDFIKTSTGFHPAGGVSLEALRIIRKYSDGIRIKASAGVRDWNMAKAVIELGAERIGTSYAKQILDGYHAAGGK